jgi:serine/threonine protein kinase
VYAVKVIPLELLQDAKVELLITELRILKYTQHPNLLSAYDSYHRQKIYVCSL